MPRLLLLYPAVVHAAILADSAWLEWLALMLLALNLLQPLFSRSLWLFMSGLLLAGAGAVLLVQLGEGRFFLYAAPVLVSLAFFWLFASSLLPGRRPLITRIAIAMRGELPPRALAYTRQVTQFWAIVMLFWTLANLLLALFASPWLWSLFANFLNYLILAGVFLAEWLFRVAYLREQETLGWREYLHKLAHLDYRRL